MRAAAQTEDYAGVFPLADTGALGRPHLCVLVDAEEDHDRTRPFSRGNTDTGAFHHVGRAQALFESHGVRPCYLATYPIVTDDAAAGLLRAWLDARSCTVGAHLHPWVTPPDEEVACLRNSYPCNLPEELEQRKLQLLSAAIAERLGEVPRVYKAGRCGIRFERREMLSDLGFEVDASVQPAQDFSGMGGGPNFLGCPSQPFWSNESRRLLHLPLTDGLIGPAEEPVARTRGDRFTDPARGARAPGLLSRLRSLEPPWRGPATSGDARRHVARLAAKGQAVFTLSLRSTDFIPGCTPYAHKTIEVENLLARLDAFLAFFLHELRGISATPLEIRRALAP